MKWDSGQRGGGGREGGCVHWDKGVWTQMYSSGVVNMHIMLLKTHSNVAPSCVWFVCVAVASVSRAGTIHIPC